MIHIIISEEKRGVYNVNGKQVDTTKPKWGKNLEAFEHKCLLNVIAAVKRINK